MGKAAEIKYIKKLYAVLYECHKFIKFAGGHYNPPVLIYGTY